MNDDGLRKLWRNAGGEFHGPNIETGTMPEAKLLPFLRELVSARDQRPPMEDARITFTIAEAKALVAWYGDDNDPETEITVARFPAGKVTGDDRKPSPAGLWCWFADYPDEGALPLFDMPSDESKSDHSREAELRDVNLRT